MTARDEHALEMDFAVARHDFAAAGEVASRVKQVLRQLGIASDLVRRAAVATYEAEMNLVIHSGGGKVVLRVDSERIVVEASDLGPGIPDIELAMREGYSTASDNARDGIRRRHGSSQHAAVLRFIHNRFQCGARYYCHYSHLHCRAGAVMIAFQRRRCEVGEQVSLRQTPRG